ncbi:hypothetical protein MJO29_012939 [Puccinia striiformis f. sp. tritici]|uniref:Uncharacterized protein n=1 Tax=Puccinia striiformis f. sp. tritici PST-78 TaxID=1165861 RepID=A0A0L0V3N5_9BASI|nr:hypothetical protein Pst134EA_024382 [Puccinia striiformis f. sp. tritici]KAI9614545.1 hypothetical protein KEM48_006011 [Puccinia striiformis f. sp. tritici PST-130]KNE93892.1 hypothetical protein PSTG_12695 [Puccinia striiformis f. sp. tritici PST-78]KAH9444813.1 hypothetical protein Pst134EB_025069 [Puccinia striiformis f. sp. tritici]KAH9453515.1 hypothetical protein Pst134EA_024382 [Puccinia striiformis f. sp. tritici]KAI7943095.1 hypothetical protein MJO29_012939 [Puccinia striiformis
MLVDSVPAPQPVYSLVNVGPHSWAPSYRSPHQINDIQSSTTFSDQLNPPPAQQVVTISPHPTTPLSESPRQFQIVRPRSIFPDDPPAPSIASTELNVYPRPLAPSYHFTAPLNVVRDHLTFPATSHVSPRPPRSSPRNISS